MVSMGAFMKHTCVALLLLLVPAQTQAAEIKVLSTGVFRGFYPDIVKKFEDASGHKIILTIETPFALRDKLLGGAQTDVVVAVPLRSRQQTNATV
jgi:ABC-type molybdate transport system substrate-binding protein